MRQREFPNCCGINTISDFGYTDVTGGDYGPVAGPLHWGQKRPPSKDEIRSYLVSTKETSKEYSMILIAINNDQKDALEPILLEEGFKLVAEGLNSKHNAMVYLYAFTFHEYYDPWVDDDDWYEEPEEDTDVD